MGVLEKYFDQLPDSFDVSALLDPDVEVIENAVYNKLLIYKYFPVARRTFFERPQLRFTQREALNDPFEMRQRWNEARADGLRDHVNEQLQKTLPELFRDPEFLIAFALEEFASKGIPLSPDITLLIRQLVTSDAGKSFIEKQLVEARALIPIALEHVFGRLELEFDQIVNNLVSKWGVLSLTEDPMNQQMWAHYASAGSGFVVGLDSQHDFFFFSDVKGKKSLLRKVVYTDERIANFWRNPYYLFLVKNVGWAYEREWRMLKDRTNCDEKQFISGSDICLWNLSPEIIKFVCFGYGFEAYDIKKEISNMLNFGSTPEFYSAQPNRSTGLLELQPIAP